ncbi:MAG TPA: class II aldolase/adducin family protein [Clostridia bacterium]|nr:class II aldolase/adducin family protein [Clostridia bacterium]
MDLGGLKELERISQDVGGHPDLVQGGGGNTSAKLGDRFMAVKASGYRLDQVTELDGYVIVDYQRVRDYYKDVDRSRDVDFERESAGFMKECVLKERNPKDLRPSIETGFHSFMDKYVIHTHSVYANILCCSKEGKDVAESIFGDGFKMLWVPYTDPGFELTIALNDSIRQYEKEKGYTPNIVFMENHGLIVSAGDAEECLRLHEKVNAAIIDYFNLGAIYPEIEIEDIGERGYRSKTSYLQDTLKKRAVGSRLFKEVILYPDQLVYLGDNVSFEGTGKVNVDPDTGEVVYRTNEVEAVTIDETFTAYIYVVDKINELGLTLQTMTEEGISFIRNMEGERYRKSLLKKDS